jgi:hypothetical protein
MKPEGPRFRNRVMAKARTNEACGRLRLLSCPGSNLPLVAAAPSGGILSMARSARQDDSRSGVERGRRSPQGVEQRRRAGRPAGGRQRVAGSASACSAARDERSGARSAPSPQPVLRRTMPTPSSFASAMPERPKDGRAREVGDGLQIGRRAHPSTARSEDGSAPVSRGHRGGRRSVIWPNTSPERGPGVTSRFAHRPVVFGPRASAASEAAASP